MVRLDQAIIEEGKRPRRAARKPKVTWAWLGASNQSSRPYHFYADTHRRTAVH
jgi:hypothetical protein